MIMIACLLLKGGLIVPAGTTLQLPDNYTGQVLLKQHMTDEGSQWASQATFTSFTAWKHGVQALKTDSAQRRLDYLRICQQVSRRFLHKSLKFKCRGMCNKQAIIALSSSLGLRPSTAIVHRPLRLQRQEI